MSRILRITVTGAECTGKTTLAAALAARLPAPWVPEAARVFVEREGRKVRPGDEDAIADLHVADVRSAERLASRTERRFVVLDTDLLSTVVYARHYQGECPRRIVRRATMRRADLYLLAMPDLPWVAEADQRGSEDDRMAVHALLEETLARRAWPFVSISGRGAARTRAAMTAIRDRLGA